MVQDSTQAGVDGNCPASGYDVLRAFQQGWQSKLRKPEKKEKPSVPTELQAPIAEPPKSSAQETAEPTKSSAQDEPVQKKAVPLYKVSLDTSSDEDVAECPVESAAADLCEQAAEDDRSNRLESQQSDSDEHNSARSPSEERVH